MKRGDILIGVGAGLVSALLYATMIRVTLMAALMFCLAPLPVAIVSLGWHQRSGLIASVVAALVVGLAFDPLSGVMFALVFALPAWWLAFLALLARDKPPLEASGVETAPSQRAQKQWYPVGNLALWAGGLSVLLTFGNVLTFSVDYETYRMTVEATARSAFSGSVSELTPLGADLSWIEGFARLAATVMLPSIAAILALLMLIILLIAAKLVAISGRLPRPMPRIARDFVLPRALLLGLAGGIGLASLAGWPRFLAVAILASLGLFLAMQGLATAHILLARVPARPVILGVGYAMIVVAMPWMLIGLAVLGFAEMTLSLRDRALATSAGRNIQ
jgi:hypothetical protein